MPVKKRSAARRKATTDPVAARRIDADPFEVIGKIPKGKSYQWVAYMVLGSPYEVSDHARYMKEVGWECVPAARHPKMPNDGHGRIVHGGQVLVERDESKTNAALYEDRAYAEAMLRDSKHHVYSGPVNFPIEENVASTSAKQPEELYEQMRSLGERRYVQIAVTIGLVLTDNEIAAACALNLDAAEYATRKFLMLADVLQLQNGHGSTRDHIKIFDRVRLTTESFD